MLQSSEASSGKVKFLRKEHESKAYDETMLPKRSKIKNVSLLDHWFGVPGITGNLVTLNGGGQTCITNN